MCDELLINNREDIGIANPNLQNFSAFDYRLKLKYQPILFPPKMSLSLSEIFSWHTIEGREIGKKLYYLRIGKRVR